MHINQKPDAKVRRFHTDSKELSKFFLNLLRQDRQCATNLFQATKILSQMTFGFVSCKFNRDLL